MDNRLILIGWSGADWDLARRLIDDGKMPNLARLMADGIFGETKGFPPYSSPMNWATVATGLHPDQHGVVGYANPDENGMQLSGSRTRRAKAIWNFLSECGKSVAVVGWPCSHPAETVRGQIVSDAFALSSIHPDCKRPAIEACVYPRSLAGELEEMRLRPQEVDTGLLGLFIPELHKKGIQFDPNLLLLKALLAELYSVHNAAVLFMAKSQPDFFALHFSFIRQVSEHFLRYHPPRHPRVNRRDHARFHAVLDSAYRLQDALLGDLLRYAGQDSTIFILSDHGFLTGAKYPGPSMPLPDANPALAGPYRPEGIFVAKGPNIAKGHLGALRLQDITPTLLAHYHHPPISEMRGRVMVEVFQSCSGTRPGGVQEHILAGGVEPASTGRISQSDEECILRILAERNLFPQEVFDQGSGSAWAKRQNEVMLGVALRELQRPLDGLVHLQAVTLDEPENLLATQALVSTLLDLRMLEDAERAARPIFDYGPDHFSAVRLGALLLMARGRCEDALKLLDQVPESELPDTDPGSNKDLQLLILAHSKYQREAVLVFETEIKKNPNRALLYLSLGNALLRTGSHRQAITALEKALKLDSGLDLANHLLRQARQCLSDGRRVPSAAWKDMAEHATIILEWEREYHDREKLILSRRESQRTTGSRVADSSKYQNAIGEDSYIVRAPWPDEEFRLQKYFKVNVSTGGHGQLWRWVIEARNPERIVGVAVLREAKFQNFPAIHLKEGLLLEWEIREGWLDKPAAESLLRTAMQQSAQMAGLPVVTYATTMGMKDLAYRIGFEKVMRREIGVMSSRYQLAQFRNRFGERLKANPIPVCPILNASAAKVKMICQRHNLLQPGLVEPATPGGLSGFDPELSFVAGCPENPAIILLAREHLGEVYLEILARNPDVPDFPRLGIIALMMRFWETVVEKGMDQTFYQITASTGAGLGSIIHRFTGQATQFWEILVSKGPRL